MALKLSADAGGYLITTYNIHSFIAWTIFLVTWGVTKNAINLLRGMECSYWVLFAVMTLSQHVKTLCHPDSLDLGVGNEATVGCIRIQTTLTEELFALFTLSIMGSLVR